MKAGSGRGAALAASGLGVSGLGVSAFFEVAPRRPPKPPMPWGGGGGMMTQAPAREPLALASSSSFWSLGARMALPRTAPFVPADHAMVTNSSACGCGSMTRPNHGPRLNPTGNSPHCSSRAFSIPNSMNRSRTHSQASVS